MGHTVQAGSVIGGSLGGGDNLDLHRELGNMIVGDRHFENRSMVGDLKRAELDDPVVGDRQQAGSRGEGRVDEDLCGVARGVGLGVGNQVGGLEIDSAARRAASPAGNPAGQLAASGPPRVVDDVGRDAVAAAGVSRELAADRRLLPLESVLPKKVLRSGSAHGSSKPPKYHHGRHTPNVNSPQLGGEYELCRVVTVQVTSALGRGPPEKYIASTAATAGSSTRWGPADSRRASTSNSGRRNSWTWNE